MFFLQSEIEDITQKVVDLFLIPRFNELNMNATGEWVASIEIEVELGKSTIRGRDYSEQLAKGRAGGSMPPISAMERWVNAKLGIYGKEANSIAWGIAKKIEKSGTSWYQKGGSDLIEVLSEPRTIQYIQDEMRAIATIRIADNLIRNAQEVLQ